jgi:hypothetical protein
MAETKIENEVNEIKNSTSTKNKKNLYIAGSIGVAVILIGFISGIVLWNNSPNLAYYKFSQSLINKNFEDFKQTADIDSISKKGLFNADEEQFNKEDFEVISENIDKSTLAKTYNDAFSDKFKKSGDRYEIKSKVVIPDTTEKLEFPIIFYFANSNGWKLNEINIDTSALGNTLTDNNSSKMMEEEKKNYDISFNQRKVLNGLELSFIKVESKELFSKPNEFIPEENVELKPNNPDNKLVRVLLSAKNTTKEAMDFDDLYTFQLVSSDQTKYKFNTSLENIYFFRAEPEEIPSGTVLYDYSAINPNTTIIENIYFEVPKNFDVSSSYIEYDYDSYGSETNSESFTAKFKLQ